MLAWKIAPALAMGNTVVLKPAEYTSLTALLFADICREAGLPKGVSTSSPATARWAALVAHEGIDKIAFTGSTEVGPRSSARHRRQGKALTLELGGKSPYIVFDDADLDSAVEGLVDAIWFNQGRSAAPARACWCRKASPSDSTPCGADGQAARRRPARQVHRRRRGGRPGPARPRSSRMVEDANTEGEVYAATPLPEGCFYPPTLITGLVPPRP
jgi:aldehyde dehydrogenase (NAD+)